MTRSNPYISQVNSRKSTMPSTSKSQPNNTSTRKRPRSQDEHDQNLSNKKSKKPKDRGEILFSDLETVEHAVESLNRALNLILRHAPSVDTYEANATINMKLHSKKILFARYLAREKQMGRLGVFSELASVVSTAPAPQSEAVIPSTPEDAEPISFNEFCKKKIDNYLNGNNSDKPWEKIPSGISWPPPLPKIPDNSIMHKVFTHKSMGRLYAAARPEDEIDVHNERLEFLGDSIVNSMFAIISYEKLPTVDEGDLTACRRQLITNNTLAEWAKMYGLDKELKIDAKFKSINKYVVGGHNMNATTPKYIADVFEAYVGGLWEYYSTTYNNAKAFDVIKPWLEHLAEPFFETIYSTGKQKPRPKGSKDTSVQSQKLHTQLNDTTTETPTQPISIPNTSKSNDALGKIGGINLEQNEKGNKGKGMENKPWKAIKEKGDTNGQESDDEDDNDGSYSPPPPRVSSYSASHFSDTSSSISTPNADDFANNADLIRLADNRDIALNAKSDLYSKIGKAYMCPKYVVEKSDPNGYFTVSCRMGDEILAYGSGRNCRIAGNVAAMKVLENDELIEKYASIRRSQPFVDKSQTSHLSELVEIGNNSDSEDDAVVLQVVKHKNDSPNNGESVDVLNEPSPTTIDEDSDSDYDYQPSLKMNIKTSKNQDICDVLLSPVSSDSKVTQSDIGSTPSVSSFPLSSSSYENKDSDKEVDRKPQPNSTKSSSKRPQEYLPHPVLTKDLIKKYTENPVVYLKEMLDPIDRMYRIEFQRNIIEKKWDCHFFLSEKFLASGTGSSKKSAKKRTFLVILLKHQQDIADALNMIKR